MQRHQWEAKDDVLTRVIRGNIETYRERRVVCRKCRTHKQRVGSGINARFAVVDAACFGRRVQTAAAA
jgi:hypothetical protein